MRTAAATLIVFALAAGSLEAQGRGRNRANSQGIPPGHLPAAGECRVWYDGVPPGRQPRPTSCREAERVAARDRNARVIYGDDRYNDRYGTGRVYEDGRYEDRSRGSNGVTGAVRERILRNRYPNQSPTPRAGTAYNSTAYDNGFRMGSRRAAKTSGTTIRTTRFGTAATARPTVATTSAMARRSNTS